MHFDVVRRILGMLLVAFSTTMLPPAGVAFATGDGALVAFLIAAGSLVILGVALWLPVRHASRELRTRDGFFVVAMFWVVLSLAGAIPLAIAPEPHLPLVDAVFESVSGLTTTGATVITSIDDLPTSMLYYRQQLQWLGGMGIIVLAVAVMPLLGIGGMQLYRAETPGPVKDAKLTPRLAQTAKGLWYIYLFLTAACALAYWAAGMSAFDAICHSFTTISTAGFSTHDASMGHFDSALIEMIAVFFMAISGVSFALHFTVWRWRRLSPWASDPELRFYFGMLITACLLVVAGLVLYTTAKGHYDFAEAWRYGIFQVVSFTTTTGYGTAGHSAWPAFVPVLLLFMSFMGGCAGSTCGGMKTIRILLLLKQGRREILRLIHPQAVIPVKMGDRPVSERIIEAVWGFFAAYVAIFVIIMLSMMALGLDQVTAFAATATSLNNLGPGLGDVAGSFATVGPAAKLLACLAMILGRLEIFTLLVLFTPAFWRR
jgi:trk system potassium uptake protein TrkH